MNWVLIFLVSWNYRHCIQIKTDSLNAEVLNNFGMMVKWKAKVTTPSHYTNRCYIDANLTDTLWADAEGDSVDWVKIPAVDSTPKRDSFWLYDMASGGLYRDSSEIVWDTANNWRGRWSFNETSGTQYDGTYFSKDGTPYGDLNKNVVGKIAGADSFDGLDDYVDCGSGTAFSITTAITLEMWVKRQTGGVWGRIIAKSDAFNYDYWLQITAIDNSIGGGFFDITDVAHYLDLTAGTAIPLNQWAYLIVLYDGTYLKAYLNGVSDKSLNIGSFTIRALNLSLWIGRLQNAYSFNGFIDEVRISNIARSAEWIQMQYLSMTDNLLTFGAEEGGKYIGTAVYRGARDY